MPELDIVLANADLQFPENVELNFVFWEHVTENVNRAIPHLLGSQAVALECAATNELDTTERQEQLQSLLTFFELLNCITERPDTPEVHDLNRRIHGQVADIYDGDNYDEASDKRYFLIADALAETGIELVPVDITLTPEIAGVHNNYDYFDDAYDITDALRNDDIRRETLIIRQLHELASRYSQTHDQARISVLYGGLHDILFIAARRLGAPATRIFLDDSRGQHGVLGVRDRMIRWGIIDADHPTTEQAEVLDLAHDIELLARKGPFNEKQAAFLIKRVFDLCQDPAQKAEFIRRRDRIVLPEYELATNPNHRLPLIGKALRAQSRRRWARGLQDLQDQFIPNIPLL